MDKNESMAGRASSLPTLTERQQQCLTLVAQGLTSKEIGRSLALSPSTVDNHIHAVIERWSCSNRAEAARLFEARRTATGPITAYKVEPGDHEAVREVAIPSEAAEAIIQISLLAKIFSLPPLGGRPNMLSLRRRYYHVVQIALLSIMGLAAAIVTISGLVHLFSR